MFKYFRIKIFRLFLEPFSNITRKRRMALFEKLIQPTTEMKILDLGGQPMIWDSIKQPLNITCLNLPGIINKEYKSHHKITYMEGNACKMPYFQPGDFDLVFSNSVIEHVGDNKKRHQFASEVLRLSEMYWIQTPSKYFPIEAHCGMPFWWFYPKGLRSYFLKKWKKNLPAWTEMVETTSVIRGSELRSIFPGCSFKHEWFFLFPKSMVAYSLIKNK